MQSDQQQLFSFGTPAQDREPQVATVPAAPAVEPEAAPAAVLGSPCAVVAVARAAGRGRVAGLLGTLFLQLVPVPVLQNLRE